MPRKTRMYVPDVPVHIVQRGNNRDACFFSDDDYLYYKQLIGEGIKRYGGELHAYCLMTNHVHILFTPCDDTCSSRVIQHVGREYVQYINKTYRRSGTLWEGRYKSSLVNAEQYLLACYRYIELNPVSAKMVASPHEYRWSSYGYNGLAKPDDLITPHAIYSSLGHSVDDRTRIYRALFKSVQTNDDVKQIRQTLSRNYPLGNDRFIQQLEAALGRKIGTGKRGRPVK